MENIRDSALQLRMVQIGDTFTRFNRVVRDVSKELDKEIELEISGAETELDKTVVEKIGDPLMHLVRNSLDHGIEPAAEGGTIRIRFARTRDELLIELANPCLGDTVSSSGNHMALANIRERLGLYYDLEARLETRQEVLPEGACEYYVQIALPYRSAA